MAIVCDRNFQDVSGIANLGLLPTTNILKFVSWLLFKKLKKVVGCCQITSSYYVLLGIAIVQFIRQTSDSKPLTLLNQGVPREATGIWPKYALETVKRWHWHLGPVGSIPALDFCVVNGVLTSHRHETMVNGVKKVEGVDQTMLLRWLAYLLPKKSKISPR